MAGAGVFLAGDKYVLGVGIVLIVFGLLLLSDSTVLFATAIRLEVAFDQCLAAHGCQNGNTMNDATTAFNQAVYTFAESVVLLAVGASLSAQTGLRAWSRYWSFIRQRARED
jgi:hypothetical protein